MFFAAKLPRKLSNNESFDHIGPAATSAPIL
jgi:hypothetical protein